MPIFIGMALESVDLLTLLKRARKPTSAPEMEQIGDTRDSEVATPVEVQVKKKDEVRESSAPVPVPVVKAEEKLELDDLRAELYADEVLIRRILGLLYRCKKQNPNGGSISILDMERILTIEREGASFVMSYMKTQKVIEMDDKSRMSITVPGIIYLRSVLGIHADHSTAESDVSIP